ncbi:MULTISPECIES: hypothetical protein [Chelatococcus]|uniref:Uncharacterized protein n=1 Tax=Chelatococcus caeni TaxID=1348468 RepID=A0A840BWX2_9HYPH|nr:MULTISPECIES: hypothetical protein [Chelatococcus]MBB4017450.1 hypothetical protein [Chelatococcus caeni]
MNGEMSIYKVDVDGLIIGECEFISAYTPRFSVSRSGDISVYAGRNWIFIKNRTLARLFEGEDIQRIYLNSEGVFIICDSVVIYRNMSNMDFSKTLLDHDELIVSSVASGGKIIVTDFRGREYRIDSDLRG